MSSLIKYDDPFEELNSLQRRFFGDDLLLPTMTSNVPVTDVYQKAGNLVVETHMPNFNKEDVDISIDKDNLVISAERHEKEEDEDKKYFVRESSNSFYRSITLPERADREAIKADMVDGKLVVTIPMAKLPEPHKIAIGDGKKK